LNLSTFSLKKIEANEISIYNATPYDKTPPMLMINLPVFCQDFLRSNSDYYVNSVGQCYEKLPRRSVQQTGAN